MINHCKHWTSLNSIIYCSIFAVVCLINIRMVSSQIGLVSTRKCVDFVLVPMDNFLKDSVSIYSETSLSQTLKGDSNSLR